MANDNNKKKYIKYEDTTYILEDHRLPDPTAEDNGKVLGVVNGEYALKQEEEGGGGGTGTVKSVNNIEPDANGDVALGASDVHALPDSTVIPTVPQMATDPDMTDWERGKTVDAATLATDMDLVSRALMAKYTKPSGGIPASDLAAGVIPTVDSALSTTSTNPVQNKVVTAALDENVGKTTLLNLLIPILRQGLYGTDQEAAISALETLLGGTPPVQTFVITNNLTNVTNSNEATAVNSGTAYTATLTPSEGMEMQTVTVTMGGVDVTASVYSNGTISIPSITGDIVITAVAESMIETYTPSLSEGYVNPTNGSVGGTSTYKHTEVIPVREGDKVYGHSVDSSTSQTVNGIAARFTATYDSNDAIYASGGSSTETVYKDTSPFVVPSGVYGVVFSIINRYANDVVVYVDKSERVGA